MHPRQAIPKASRCTHRAKSERCDADLAAATVLALPADHPVLAHQKLIDETIEDGNTAFGIYAAAPPNARVVLADIKIIAGQFFSINDEKLLREHIPRSLQRLYLAPSAQSWLSASNSSDGVAHLTSAAAAATAITVALGILENTDVSQAADQMRWLIANPPDDVKRPEARYADSQALAMVRIKARAPRLSPARQLRYRAILPIPRPPDDDAAAIDLIGRSLPTAIWPAWALLFQLPVTTPDVSKQALCYATLLVGNQISATEARKRLGTQCSMTGLHSALADLQHDPCWQDVVLGLTRLNEYLRTNPAPIDYDRRRQLDYTRLLPDTRWLRLCNQAEVGTGNGHKSIRARGWLFEQLTGSPTALNPFVRGRRLIEHDDDFCLHLTPVLSEGLIAEGISFLRAHDIDEPAAWEPPLELLDGLRLPGLRPTAIDLDLLHDLVTSGVDGIAGIASQLHTTTDAIRYLLTKSPADPQPGSVPLARTIKAELTPDALRHLYLERELSLSAIARKFGVREPLIAYIARQYGIKLRPHSTPPPPVDREWLYGEVVLKQRSLVEVVR